MHKQLNTDMWRLIMVNVVKKEPCSSVVKEVACRKCGWTLSYVPLDIKQDYSTDYTGDKDYFNYINCPNTSCNNQVKVK